MIMGKPGLWAALAAFLVIGAVAGAMAKKDAALLGLTAVELGLLSAATGAYVTRKLA
jgi:hypothetical protein